MVRFKKPAIVSLRSIISAAIATAILSPTVSAQAL